jgi:hypothetical protein
MQKYHKQTNNVSQYMFDQQFWFYNLHLFHMEYTTRNLHINDWFFGLIFNCKCHMWLQFALGTLNKSHKISIANDNTWTIHGTKSQWQSHEDVTYMNISSIQISLRGVVISWLLYN